MHHWCNTSHSLCTLVRDVPEAEAEGRESEAALAHRNHALQLSRNPRSSRDAGRATRLYADAGRGGARGESNDLQPTGAAAARDDRHAMGSAARSGRRARAVRKGATSACSRARADGVSGTTDCYPRRARASHSGRAREGQEPAPDRPRPERDPDADRTWRRAVVALDGAGGSPPRKFLTHASPHGRSTKKLAKERTQGP